MVALKCTCTSLLTAATAITFLAGSVLADFAITAPTSDVWWVAKSQNVLTWTCQDNPPATQYTVVIANKDPKILTGGKAIIAIQQNSDCSKLITQDQSDQPAGTGYTIQLTDILNQTHIYASSQEFEIKALGAAYPTTTPGLTSSTASGASPSGTNSANNSKPSGNGASAGRTMDKMERMGLLAGVVGLVGLVVV